MRALDIGCCAAYFLLIAWIGHRAARRGAGAVDAGGVDFHLAGRSAGGLVVGLSVMVTAFSATNFVLFPTEVAGHGLYVAACLPVFGLVAWPVVRWVLPFFLRQRSPSAYGWLEAAHGPGVRRLASTLFILWRLLWMALALLAAARFLAQVTGGSVPVLLVLSAGVATAYTALGGMRAVLWTDAAQFVVLTAAIAVATVAVADRAGGFVVLGHAVHRAGGLAPFAPYDPQFLTWDPRVRISLGSALVGTFVAFLARYVADQSIVQRYLSAKSLDAARRGFLWNVAGALLSVGMLLVLGVALRANALLDPSLAARPVATQLAQLLRGLPPGALGLVAAGLMAATMSSLDSGLHSCTTSMMVDWRAPGVEPSGGGRRGRWCVSALGLLATLLALAAQGLGDLFVIANRVVNGLGSPLLALMLAAMLPWGATRRGIFWGTVLGAAWSILLTAVVAPLAIHHYATMNLAASLLAIALASGLDRLLGRPAPA